MVYIFVLSIMLQNLTIIFPWYFLCHSTCFIALFKIKILLKFVLLFIILDIYNVPVLATVSS
jgi:hypothetical protein